MSLWKPVAPLPLLLALAACGGTDPAPAPLAIVTDDPPDLPLAGLDAPTRARFADGDLRFEAIFRAADGLGPVYIRHSCASCHADDAKGPGAVTKMVFVEADGFTPREDQSALAFGHTVRPQISGPATGIHAPDEVEGLKLSKRFGPSVFGRGYLEAIADSEIERVEAEQAARGGLVRGRINRVTRQSERNPDSSYHTHGKGESGLVGRFGLKARIASVDDFTADAFQGDMGITSPLRTDELPNPAGLTDDERAGLDVDADTVNAIADYVRLIAIPRRAEPDPRGVALFDEVGCAQCHVPSLKTRDDYPIPQLAGIDAPVYTDMLLHDMGTELADGMVEYGAGPRDWRTAPLMGLRHLRNYLHDGRAASIEDAILFHESEGSEANDVITSFRALSRAEKDTLVEFVSSL